MMKKRSEKKRTEEETQTCSCIINFLQRRARTQYKLIEDVMRACEREDTKRAFDGG